MNNIEEKVKAIIAQQLSVSAEKIVPGARFVEGLGSDSLDTGTNLAYREPSAGDGAVGNVLVVESY